MYVAKGLAASRQSRLSAGLEVVIVGRRHKAEYQQGAALMGLGKENRKLGNSSYKN